MVESLACSLFALVHFQHRDCFMRGNFLTFWAPFAWLFIEKKNEQMLKRCIYSETWSHGTRSPFKTLDSLSKTTLCKHKNSKLIVNSPKVEGISKRTIFFQSDMWFSNPQVFFSKCFCSSILIHSQHKGLRSRPAFCESSR